MAKQTREEYLAGSLSRREPWKALGISRRSWYRQHRAQADGTSPRGTSGTSGTSPRGTGPKRVTKSGWSAKPADEVVLKVRTRLRAAHSAPTDRTAVNRIITDLYGDGKDAARKAYDRALPDIPIFNRWVSLVCQWAGRRCDATPEAPWDVIYDLIALATPKRFARLGEWFDSIAGQWGGEDKFNQLLKLRDALRADPDNFPKRRAQRGESAAIVEDILALMRTDPKRFRSRADLADEFGKTVKAIWHLTTEMCDRGLIEVVDRGKGLLGIPGASAGKKKSVSGRIIEKLIEVHEMRFSDLARAIGVEPYAMSTPVQTLRRIGILEPGDRHPDPNKRAPLRLSADVRAKVSRGKTITDRRGFVLWAPAGH
jgi:hypothetical protein